MSEANRYHLNDMIEGIEKTMKTSEFVPTLYSSVENVADILTAIVETGGENWTDHLRMELNESEKKHFSSTFQPFIPQILSFFGAMKGGTLTAEEIQAMEDHRKNIEEKEMPGTINAAIPAINKAAIPAVINKAAIPGEISQLATASIVKAFPKPERKKLNNKQTNETPLGPDDAAESIVSVFNGIDSAVKKFAAQNGILKLENDADKEEDYHIIPMPLVPMLGPSGPVIRETLKIPFRAIVMIIYLFLDISRMAAAAANRDTSRQTLSIIIALFDFLRGDWKKAILSIMGYFGNTSLFIGQFGKVFLTLFQTLSPTIQDQFIFGTVDSVKSLMVGFLLMIFKLGAPYAARMKVMAVFDTIRQNKQRFDSKLEEAKLNPLPDYMAPDFSDLNNLQSLMDDPAFICSKEHMYLVENADKSLNLVFQLLRIPVTHKFKEYKCGINPKSFIDNVIERQSKTKTLKAPDGMVLIDQATKEADEKIQKQKDEEEERKRASEDVLENAEKADSKCGIQKELLEAVQKLAGNKTDEVKRMFIHRLERELGINEQKDGTTASGASGVPTVPTVPTAPTAPTAPDGQTDASTLPDTSSLLNGATSYLQSDEGKEFTDKAGKLAGKMMGKLFGSNNTPEAKSEAAPETVPEVEAKPVPEAAAVPAPEAKEAPPEAPATNGGRRLRYKSMNKF